MAIALVANTQSVGASSGSTSPAINTTGATFLVVHVATSTTGTAVLTDSNSNTWTLAVDTGTVQGHRGQIYFCPTPTVGSGHTITTSGASTFATATFLAFTGVATTLPLDTTKSIQNNGTTVAAGSMTPAQNNSLIVTGDSFNTLSSTLTVTPANLIITNQANFVTGVAEGCATAYAVQTVATAINCTWTATGNQGITAAVFKPNTTGATYAASPTDSAATSDLNSGSVGGNNSDTISTSDQFSGIGLFLASLNDATSASDGTTGFMIATSLLSDSHAATELLTAIASGASLLSDSVSSSDSTTPAFAVVSSIADTIATMDGISGAALAAASVLDTLAASDLSFGSVSYSLSDTLSNSDALSTIVSISASIMDAVTAGDLITFKYIIALAKPFIVPLLLSESFRVGSVASSIRIGSSSLTSRISIA